MGAWLGVVAPTGAVRDHAGKNTATVIAEKQAAIAALSVPQTTGNNETKTDFVRATTTTDDESSEIDDDIFDFGLEDDGTELVEWEPPTRKKTCDLTPEEQAKFRGLVEKIFSKDTVTGSRFFMEGMDVIEVCQRVIPYLESEPVLIEDIPFGISVVGDLHGQLYDLHRVFFGDSKDGKPGWETKKYIFLGDYVDRGRQSLEIVIALFCLKMLYPDNIFLLRGNHEFVKTNAHEGFLEEMLDRYTDEATKIIYFQINETFCYLSIAAILGNDYLCVHAGIGASHFTRDTLRGIAKPILRSTDDVLVHDMVWSDPARGLNGTTCNVARRTSFYFGFPALAVALITMEVKIIFRGHQRVQAGFERLWGCCYTIFTATDSGYSGNKGAVAVIDEKGKVHMRILEVSLKRRALEKQYDLIMGRTPDDEDDKTKFEPRHDKGKTAK